MASNASPEKTTKPSAKRTSVFFIAGSAVLVFLGLTLGLGLGLGLRKGTSGAATQGSSSPTPSTPLPGTAGSGTARLEAWRQDPSEYVLDTKWDINAPPTTRHYDLVISEGQGWPDGMHSPLIRRRRC